MNTYLLSRWAYLAGVVLAVVVALPVVWLPVMSTKVALWCLGAAVAAALLVWGGSVREAVRSWGSRGAAFVLLLPAAYMLSWFFSVDRTVGIWAEGAPADTVLFSVLCALAFVLSFAMFKTLRGASQLVSTLFWMLCAVTILQGAAIIQGPGAFFGFFQDPSFSVVGKWNDLGVLAALLLALVVVRVDFGAASRRVRAALIVLGAALVLILCVINFSLAWGAALGACAALAAVAFALRRGAPYAALAGAVISLVMLFFGAAINLELTRLFPISSLEVRPSYATTLDVVNAGRADSPGRLMLGTGPNTFGESWLLHRPVEVNRSQFWNIDFVVGYSTLLTVLGSVGLLGFIGWLMAPLLVLAGVVRVIRTRSLAREDTVVALSLLAGCFVLLAALAFYAPSQNLILLFFTLSGSAFAFLWRQGQAALPHELSRVQRAGALVIGAVVVIAAVAVAAASVVGVVRESLVNRGTIALGNGEYARALSYADSAKGLGASGGGMRLMTSAHMARLQELAATTSSATLVRDLFAASAKDAIASGQATVAFNPRDYRGHLLLGNVYALLASLKVEGAAASARSEYQAAATANPKSPTIPLLQAQLEAVAGDPAALEKRLAESLTLKADYTDAILVAVQLYVARGDAQNAIQAAAAAVRSAPGIPSLWFQLGVLLWSANNAKDAVPALEKAVELQKDYANAKYFLGLSYWAEGRTEEAIRQFADLAATNPDNAEVQTTLQNMRAGTQPVRPNPPTAKSAPVQQ